MRKYVGVNWSAHICVKLFRAAAFHGKQTHHDSVHLHTLGLVLKVTNGLKIVTQALPTPSHVAHT